MELPLEEFDMILGMDWLSEHRVSLDCKSKIATLKTPDDRTVILVGERRGYLSNVVSVLIAERMIRKGYETSSSSGKKGFCGLACFREGVSELCSLVYSGELRRGRDDIFVETMDSS
ncbi:hypothetical protein V6N12_031496 [Hibiscus sabdariffa]|uniref:Uncharacterized protein n=1 Tax=Hibiscus sabdariffa TaxID=183260 RepID=A0ABR2CPF0_9ROSI